jgi:FkbM family methyltransferase
MWLKRLIKQCYYTIFCRKHFYTLNKALYQLALHGLGMWNQQIENGAPERHLLRTCAKKLAYPVLDVGANVGKYVRLLKDCSTPAKIFAFEPHPENFKHLLSRVEVLDGVTAINAAVGKEECQMDLYDMHPDGSPLASLHKGVMEEFYKTNALVYKVNVLKLDSFCAQQGIERVSLLKIDTEGNELAVLQGFEKYITEGRVDMIQFEFNEMNVISGVFFKHFWELLPHYNFYRLMPDGRLPIRNYYPAFCEIFVYQNILAILKKYDKNGEYHPE